MEDKKQEHLRSIGLKATGPRIAILNLFENSTERHLSAEDVHRKLSEAGHNVSLATIYRVLAQFEQSGLVMRHFFESERACFELNDSSHHDHIICVDCGHVEEFFDEDIERCQNKIVRDLDYELFQHSLYMYVKCRKEDCPRRCVQKSVDDKSLHDRGPSDCPAD